MQFLHVRSLLGSAATAAPATVLVSSGALGVPPYAPPNRVPTPFIACVRRADSAQQVRVAVAAAALHGLAAAEARVTVLAGQTVRGALAAADVMLLACKVTAVRALAGKAARVHRRRLRRAAA